jgi:hypothetical protein
LHTSVQLQEGSGLGIPPVRVSIFSKIDRNKRFSHLLKHSDPTFAFPSALLPSPYLDTVMSKSEELPSNGDQQTIEAAHGTTVSEKYQGTRFDQQDMSMLGKKQVLRRQFKFSTMLGFAS